MVDLVQATREAWKKNDELREENQKLRVNYRNAILALYRSEEENVNLREMLDLPLD
jgi:hypothetical protein